MTLSRLTLSVLWIVAAQLVISGSALAQERFPSRPITLLNPLAVGGGVDIAMRGLAAEMQPLLGQTVVVLSRPGAGGLIAGQALARAKPDGYTMGLLQSTQAIPEAYDAVQKAPYTSDELRPVVRFMKLVFALPSRADAPWKTFPEFVSYVRANPNKVRWGRTVGLGHPLHLLSYSLLAKNNLQVIDVPFKGAGEAIIALLGGHVDVAFGVSVTSIETQVRAGKMSILALHNAERLKAFPDAPTFAEQGVDPGVPPIYNTFFVPKGTPDDVVKRLHDAVKAAMETPAMREHAQRNQYELYYGSEADILDELRRDRAVSMPLVQMLAKDKPPQ
jgi:tripartite-type tricarboxylate transporter receptor subunit TctC